MVRLKRLNPNDNVKPFDCGNEDLNGFLLEDNTSVPNAKHHANELLAVTYIIEDEEKEQTIAYFSLLNDKIDREITDNIVWNRLSREIPNIKRRKSQPAVKIGRLAVSTKWMRNGLGSILLDFIKSYFTKNRRTGCRFLTVDAYHGAVDFYAKNGFVRLSEGRSDGNTCLMYYDLIDYKSKL